MFVDELSHAEFPKTMRTTLRYFNVAPFKRALRRVFEECSPCLNTGSVSWPVQQCPRISL